MFGQKAVHQNYRGVCDATSARNRNSENVPTREENRTHEMGWKEEGSGKSGGVVIRGRMQRCCKPRNRTTFEKFDAGQHLVSCGLPAWFFKLLDAEQILARFGSTWLETLETARSGLPAFSLGTLRQDHNNRHALIEFNQGENLTGYLKPNIIVILRSNPITHQQTHPLRFTGHYTKSSICTLTQKRAGTVQRARLNSGLVPDVELRVLFRESRVGVCALVRWRWRWKVGTRLFWYYDDIFNYVLNPSIACTGASKVHLETRIILNCVRDVADIAHSVETRVDSLDHHLIKYVNNLSPCFQTQIRHGVNQ
ncbi:hypothetical protein K438DRAFT_2066692 [Mycena galopus ATCC 62051]|nr:hypothetical protein K438DRAFT_2066692 [Mycena galopus ATCC 62051]